MPHKDPRLRYGPFYPNIHIYVAHLFASRLLGQPRTKPTNFKTSSSFHVVGPLPCSQEAWNEQPGGGLTLRQHVMARSLLTMGMVKVEAWVWTRKGDLQVWSGPAHLGSPWVSGTTVAEWQSAQYLPGTWISSWNLQGRTGCSWAPG